MRRSSTSSLNSLTSANSNSKLNNTRHSSSNSLNSLTSTNSNSKLNNTRHSSSSSLNSLTSTNSKSKSNFKIINNDFNEFNSNFAEDIAKISNDYYYYSNVFNNKINNIVDRYERRTNKLYVNAMNREDDYKRMNANIECITKDLQECKNTCIANNAKIKYIDEQHIVNNTYKYDIRDYIDKIENLCKYILIFLYIYTIWVICMIINFHMKGSIFIY